MYVEHSKLSNTQGNDKLWKYMSLSKFLNLLNGKIYFNRVDCFEDIFEATFPAYNSEHRKEIYKDVDVSLLDPLWKQMEYKAKLNIYVSCFHKNDYESAFMWKQYSDSDGIAIVTSVNRLKESFHNEPREIYICDVTYIDYETEFLPEGNIIYLSLYKRKSFEHEKEVRCLFVDDLNKPQYTGQSGILMNADLQLLIDQIYISPYAPKYLKGDIERILRDKKINVEVINSPLYTMK